MGLHFENFGFKEFYDDKDTVIGLGRYTAEKGKAFIGYYDIPYLYHNFGDMEVIVTSDRTEDGVLEVTRIDNHCRGNCIWDAVLEEWDINPKDQDKMHQRVMIEGANGMRNMAIVDLIHADVLPSFLGGDAVKMQIIGFPKLIELYETEDDYMEAQDEWQGKKLGLADGLIAPTGFMKNHDPENPEFEKNPDEDTWHVMRGRINKILWGRFALEEMLEKQAFLLIFVQTRVGELQLVCSHEQIREEDFRLLKPGMIVSAVVALSGDVAIGEYQNGIVLDEENDLSLLRYSMTRGDPERLRSALSEDAVYRSEVVQSEFYGPDSIIQRIAYVQKNANPVYTIRKGTITGTDGGEQVLSHGAGSRCLILYSDNLEVPESLCFIETDEDGRIREIRITNIGGCHFKEDEPPVLKEPEPEDENDQ